MLLKVFFGQNNRKNTDLPAQAVKWNYLRNNSFKDISKDDWHYITPAEFQSLLTAIDNMEIRPYKEQEDRERIYRKNVA